MLTQRLFPFTRKKGRRTRIEDRKLRIERAYRAIFDPLSSILYLRNIPLSRLLTLSLILLLIVGCAEETQEEEIIRPVRYQQALSAGGNRARTFSGTAQAGAESSLSFKVAGTIQQMPVVVGTQVRQGNLIASLDPSDYLLGKQQALAAVQQAQAQQRNAREIYDRVKGLYENQNASLSDLEAARAGHDSAIAAVDLARARLEQADLQVQYTRLYAPTNGAIAQVNVEVNENAQAGQRVVVMTSGDRPEVQVAVPEQLITQIRIGNPVTVTFDALPGQTHDAVVREAGVAATRAATTFPVTVRLVEDNEEVRPGMAAEVTFRFSATGEQGRGVIVPSASVGEDRQGRFVFALEPVDGDLAIARRRTVQIGELTAEGIVVLDGLQDGELVATAGTNFLEDGQRVRLLGQ